MQNFFFLFFPSLAAHSHSPKVPAPAQTSEELSCTLPGLCCQAAENLTASPPLLQFMFKVIVAQERK